MSMSTAFVRGLGLALGIALASPALAQVKDLRGRVLDDAGKPAAGARVGRTWSFPDPAGATAGSLPAHWGSNQLFPALADERGEFLVPWAVDPFLFALSADARTGVVAPVDTPADAPHELVLAPLVEVRGRFEIHTPGEAPKKTAFWVAAGAGMPSFVAVCITESRAFRVCLPAGTYTLWYSTDAVNLWSMDALRDEPLKIEPGQGALDLGAFTLDLPLVLHPQGVVLDSGGKPVLASLGQSWNVRKGRMDPYSGFESDESGRFRGNIESDDANAEIVLLALDSKREQAALATWKAETAETPLEIRLQPAVRVFGSYRTSAGDVPVWTNTYIYADLPGREESRSPRVAECQSKEGRFEFRLPPGKYKLNGYGTNTKDTNLELVLTADARERDLGVLELPQTVIARNVGKAALPWHVSDARGVAKDVTLADFRGKWVLLEFWGFW